MAFADSGCASERCTRVQASATTHPTNVAARIFIEGDDLYAAMLRDIRAARSSVLFETYIFKPDRSGREFVAALRHAARAGVSVYLRIDAFGTGGLMAPSTVADLVGDGVTVSWSGAWSWRRPLRYWRRNHRKLLVIDRGTAYLGGFNIGDENSLKRYGAGRWRDTHVRLTGTIAARAGELFWDFESARHCTDEAWLDGALLMPNYGFGCRYRWRCALNAALRGARERIWVTTPYFVPDRRTQNRLEAAARRGVDVKLMVPAKNDVPIVQWAARMSYDTLLRSGVEIHEYGPRVLHAKTILIDDDWSTIGTSNFDYRSFFTNYELNYLSRSPHLNAELARVFTDDLANCEQISRSAWPRRPLSQQAREVVGWVARRWL